MRVHRGQVRAIQIDEVNRRSAWLSVALPFLPAPGQFVLAQVRARVITKEPLPTVLFAADYDESGFRAAPPIPSWWFPGLEIALSSPMGVGFAIPKQAKRVALATLAANAARLMPLASLALRQGAAVSLLSPTPISGLSPDIEIQPISALSEVVVWADYLALDITPQSLDTLRGQLGLEPYAKLPCLTQVLVDMPLPCAGVGECMACAVPASRGWKQTCKHGPVFDLNALAW